MLPDYLKSPLGAKTKRHSKSILEEFCVSLQFVIQRIQFLNEAKRKKIPCLTMNTKTINLTAIE